MKALPCLRILALAAAGLLLAGPRAGAQGFGLSVTASADSVLVSNSVTYTIGVTNLNAFPLVDTLVTNQLSAPFQFVSATSPQGTYTTTSSNVVFDLGPYFSTYLQVAQLTLTVQPTETNSFTNAVSVGSITVTNIASTNVVVLVTNPVPTLADLGVTVAGPVQPVVTNDWMTYFVMATNFGPNTATGTVLTNTLPPGVKFLGATPANYTTSSNNLIFNLGALAAGAATNFQFTIQPTNVGPLTLSASIGSGVLDTNTVNNSATTNVTVTNYAGQLVVFTNSAQSTNFLNGLLEQGITVSNAGLSSVSAARVVVNGLTNRLFNAFGTNNGNPFVVCVMPSGVPLTPGQSVNALLQYFPRRAFPFTSGQLQAFAAPIPDLTPPPASMTSTNVNLTRILRLFNGNMLIEWPALTNRTYTVVYSDNISFSNAMIAPPSLVAPANDVEWIDYGPPTTVSAPMNSSNRFYRVLLNP